MASYVFSAMLWEQQTWINFRFESRDDSHPFTRSAQAVTIYCPCSVLNAIVRQINCLIVTRVRILRDSRSRHAADENPYPNGLAVTPCGFTVVHILRDSHLRHADAWLSQRKDTS